MRPGSLAIALANGGSRGVDRDAHALYQGRGVYVDAIRVTADGRNLSEVIFLHARSREGRCPPAGP